MTIEPPKQDIIITRVFDAPVASVWQAWTDPALVMEWWGPEGFTCPLAQMDVREGGTSLVCMHSPDYGDYYSTWHYERIVPMERIEYIHNMTDATGNPVDPVEIGMPPDFPQNQHHVVSLHAVDATSTALTVTEYAWPVGEMLELSRMGLEQCLDTMAAIFARAKA